MNDTADKTKKEFTPGEIAVAKSLIGLGLIGLALWLSPVALGDLLTFAIPLLVIFCVLSGMGLMGSGLLETLNSKNVAEKAQQILHQYTNMSNEEQAQFVN